MSNARFSILQARAVKDKRISDAQFRTLAALGMYADEEGWCYPLLSTLGADLGKSKQAVGRDTIALREIGYLEVTARYDKNGARRSSLYRLKFDLPRQPDVDTPSTNQVDTPSTSEVDVNDPINDPKNLNINKQSIELFKNNFGRFRSSKELVRWNDLYSIYGETRSEEVIAWVLKKEIHLENRPGLLDSLETAAKNWKDKPVRVNGKTPTSSVPAGVAAAQSWLAKKEAENVRTS
jgi:hypothetical protein